LDAFFKNLELQLKEMGTAFRACRSCVSFANTFRTKVNAKLKEMDKRVDNLQEQVESNTGGLEEVKEKVETVEKKVEKLEK
jgi:peptidoglycan hydrolase CwlO-like protein